MLLEQIIKAVFPSACYGCGIPDTYLCYDCYHVRDLVPEPACPHCEKRLPFGKLSNECKKELALDRLFSCANYNDEGLNKLIKGLKYRYAYKLAEPLAAFTAWWLQNEGYTDEVKNGIDLVTPVPSHRKQLKKRGFNHAELVAEHFAIKMAMPADKNVLAKNKKTGSQVEAGGRSDREKNLIDAFAVVNNKAVAGKTVLLVDDVLTTGSTLRECAKVLQGAGAKEVWGLTIARE